MHDCLALPEIVESIFQECTWISPDGVREGLVTLTRLARTCKAFHEPSLQILWEEIPGLHVLVGHFPEGTLEHDKKTCFWAFKAPQTIKSIPITRIQKSCSYVRALDYNADIRLHQSVLLAIYNSAKNKQFFPKLEEAAIPCILQRPMETMMYTPFIINPRLKRICFATNAIFHQGDPSIEGPPGMDEPAQFSLDSRLATIAHQITTILPSYHLGPFPMGLRQFTYTPAMADFLRHVGESFTTFDAGYGLIEIPAMIRLTQLPCLTTLSFVVQQAHLSAAMTDKDFWLTFPTLTTLNITFTGSTMNPFFERLQAPLLQTLCIELWDTKEGELVLQGVHRDSDGQEKHGIADIPVRYELLRSFTIRVHDLVPDTIPLYFSLHPTGLRAFSTLRHLESLCITPCTIDKLMDQDIIDAFKLWPRLKSFILHDDPLYAGITPTNLTLGGTRIALDACPDVEELVLPCDAVHIPTFISNPYPALRMWDFCNSPLDSGVECAKWLQVSYPNLKKIMAFTEYRERIIFHPPEEDEIPMHALEGLQMMAQWADVCTHSEAVFPME